MSAEAERPNADQAEYWNSDAASKWLAYQDLLDTVLAGVQDRLVARADPQPGQSVLEIGCGAGATSLALAERVGQGGRVLAVDISAPLIGRARERAVGLPQVAFALADAQTHGFDAAFDLVASRFGVMFFDDPVAAFRNIRRALRAGGRICFVAWGPLPENPWFAIPRDAAIERLGKPAPQPPTAPGPLAFADRDYVGGVLDRAGFAGVTVQPEAVELSWPGGLEALADLATNLGPAARIMRERGGGPEDAAAIRDAVAAGLAPFRGADGICVPALLNVVMARNA